MQNEPSKTKPMNYLLTQLLTSVPFAMSFTKVTPSTVKQMSFISHEAPSHGCRMVNDKLELVFIAPVIGNELPLFSIAFEALAMFVD